MLVTCQDVGTVSCVVQSADASLGQVPLVFWAAFWYLWAAAVTVDLLFKASGLHQVVWKTKPTGRSAVSTKKLGHVISV